MPFDLIIVGGGLAGSSLAIIMARQGAAVLVLEREERFRDRIRGEGMHPWGVAEARALGILDALLERCASEVRWLDVYSGDAEPTRRDLVDTCPSMSGMVTWYHPEMQEALLALAREAGAEVWRGASVTDVLPGDPPLVTVVQDRQPRTLRARLVIGADGRESRVRRWGGFAVERDPNHLTITGVLVAGLPASAEASYLFSPVATGFKSQFLPVGAGRYRTYVASGNRERTRQISGRAGAGTLFQCLADTGVPAGWIEGLRIEGPLGTFEGAAAWADRPYRDGVVLIGDAAAAPDPCFGNGQSLAMRDVRVLSSELLADSDWHAAASRYAAAHDEYFHAIRRIEHWAAEAYYSFGPEKQVIRDHAAEASRRGDAPDIIACGPDQPSDDAARMRFLGY